MPASHDYMDGAYDLLERRPHLLVFNNTNILNDTTILSLRYGWTTWQDQNDRVPVHRRSGVARVQPDLRQRNPRGRSRLCSPDLNFDEVRDVGLSGGTRRRWKGPYSINAALSKLAGNHQFKLGADLRRLGIATTTFNENAGDFTFSRAFSSRAGCGEQRSRAGQRSSWACRDWDVSTSIAASSNGTRVTGVATSRTTGEWARISR